MLLVDDDELILEILTTILDLEEFDVVTASSGDDALRRLRDEDVDMVVLDVMMPGKDGYAVCREIKDDTATAALPVVLLTARDQPDDLRQGEAAGCDAYLTKPFSPLELIEVLNGFGASGGGG